MAISGKAASTPMTAPPWGKQLVKAHLPRRKRLIGKMMGMSRASHDEAYYFGQSLGGKPLPTQEVRKVWVAHHGNYIVGSYKKALAIGNYGNWPAGESEEELETGDFQFLALQENDSLPLSVEESEITIVSALNLLLKDTLSTVRDHSFNWTALLGGLFQLLVWSFGGFDVQFEAVVGLVVLYLFAKALLDLRAGAFGLAAWRIFHFPIWMFIVAAGHLAELSRIPELRPVSRELALTFVGIWCMGGATNGFMQLLGIERVDRFRRDLKRIVRENFFQPEE